MKKLLISGIMGVFVAYASNATAEMAKEGKISMSTVFAGASVVLPMGDERLQINYEGTGLSLATSGKGFGHYATIWCVGSLQAVKGKYDNDAGLCQTTYTDGDKTYVTYKAKGELGKPTKGTWTYVGGTGIYESITGSGEFTRIPGRPAKEGTFQTHNITTGSYKLP